MTIFVFLFLSSILRVSNFSNIFSLFLLLKINYNWGFEYFNFIYSENYYGNDWPNFPHFSSNFSCFVFDNEFLFFSSHRVIFMSFNGRKWEDSLMFPFERDILSIYLIDFCSSSSYLFRLHEEKLIIKKKFIFDGRLTIYLQWHGIAFYLQWNGRHGGTNLG